MAIKLPIGRLMPRDHGSIRIVLIYIILGAVYIILSDRLVWQATGSHLAEMDLTFAQTLKGLLFIALSALLLYFLIRRNNRKATTYLEEISRREKNYRLLAENTSDVIFHLDENGTYRYISPSVQKVLGYQPSDLAGKEHFSFVHPKDRRRIREALMALRGSGNNTILEYRYRTKDGFYRWLESNMQPVDDDGKIPDQLIFSSRDITDRIQKHVELNRYQRMLQKMTLKASLVEETQRKEIASNIHDHLSQLLILTGMKLSRLGRKELPESLKLEVSEIESQVSEALERSRNIINDLSPPILYQLGLIETMDWFVEKISRENRIRIRFTHDMETLGLSKDHAVLIYRILQELFHNIIKHAGATSVVLEFSGSKEGLTISLIDDGKGFSPEKADDADDPTGGFGLFTIRERVRNLGGRFDIRSKPGKGTETILFFPTVIPD